MDNGMSQIIEDWLNEFDKFNQYQNSAKEIHGYAIGVFNYPDLISAILNTLEDPKQYDKLLAPICNQLFNYYRLKDDRLRLFVLSFIPSLIGIHLTNCIKSLEVRRRYHCVDTLLLGVYNLEVTNEDGLGNNKTFRIPSICKPSIYHEPPTTSLITQSSLTLTDGSFIKSDAAGAPFMHVPLNENYKEADHINAANRNIILTSLLHVFHDHLSSLPKQSYSALCRMAISVLEIKSSQPSQNEPVNFQNGDTVDNDKLINYSVLASKTPRSIPLSSRFLVRLLSCVYFCMFNGVEESGLMALEVVHSRALFDLYSDVLLMTNAIKNSLLTNPSGQPSDGPMGISVALSPTSTVSSSTNTLKTAITNASFKTRKLPEDIPIVTSSTVNTNPQRLPSINEDVNEQLN